MGWLDNLSKISSLLSIPRFARDFIGVYNEYTIGKGIRRNIEGVDLLIPALRHTLGDISAGILLSKFAVPAGVAALALNVWQGHNTSKELNQINETMEANMALKVPKKFAIHIWDFLRQRVKETAKRKREEHWFFIYHPDTNWQPAFYNLKKDVKIMNRCLGMSESLPKLCHFMMRIRQQLRESGDKRKIAFHILMPAYQRLDIEDTYEFHSGLYPLIIEGHIFKSSPFVTLRVKNEERRGDFRLRGVRNAVVNDETSWFQKLFSTEPAISTLGEEYDDNGNIVSEDSNDGGSEEDQEFHGLKTASVASSTSEHQNESHCDNQNTETQGTWRPSTKGSRKAWVRRRNPSRN